MKVEELINADKERWQLLYRGYADFYLIALAIVGGFNDALKGTSSGG